MMHKNRRRCLSLVLALVMIFSLLPLNAMSAEEEGSEAIATETTPPTEEVTETTEPEATKSPALLAVQEKMDAILEYYLGTADLTVEEAEALVAKLDPYDTASANMEVYELELSEEFQMLTNEELMILDNHKTFWAFSDAVYEKAAAEGAISTYDVKEPDTNGTTGTVLDGTVSIAPKWFAYVAIINTHYGSVNYNGNVVTLTADGGKYTQYKTTTTITNNSGEKAVLQFAYTASSYSAFTIDSSAAGDSGTHIVTLDVGASCEVSITGAAARGAKATLTLTFLSLTPTDKTYDVTVNYDSSMGSITVGDNTSPDSGYVAEGVSASNGIALTASASNSTFLGWVNETTHERLTTATSYTFYPSSDCSVRAVFASASSDAWFLVDNVYMTDDLNTAATLGSKIVPMFDGTLPAGDYTIPAGVTLLIPYDDAHTLCTEKPTIAESPTTPSVYRMLTMASGAHIAVNGAISVGGQQRCSLPLGAVSGKYGVIEMAEGSSITVNNGGFLYAWGYIAGVKGSNNTVSEGTVTIESGGTVYEDFQITDWRGGTATLAMIEDETVFPMSQYYVQNVQVPMTLKSGAKENTFTSVSVTLLGLQEAPVSFIGEGGMFLLGENTSIIKDYDEAADRLTLKLVEGSVSLGSVQMELRVVQGKIDINSANFVLPLNNNITIIANSGTTLSAANDVAMLPGSELVLEEGSNFNITSGSYYIYDLDEWTYDTTDTTMVDKLDGNTYNNGGYCSEYNWVMAAAPYAHDRIKTRTTADLKDAEVKVDGTITVSDGAYVYTTAGGANVYSTGTGKIEFKGAPGTGTTTYQAVATTSDRTGVAYVDIPITSAKLRNENGSYVETASATAATTYNHDHYVCCNDTATNATLSKCGTWYAGTHSVASSEVTKPTCTAQGYTTYTCTCRHVYNDNYVAANGHSWGDWAVTDATCTEDGSKTRTCTVSGCGKTETETLPAAGHSYSSSVTAPTCTDQGYTTHTCAACGDSYVGDYVSATGHSYESVETKPTCTMPGYTTYTCSQKDHSYVVMGDPATGHSYGDDDICDVCGAEKPTVTFEVKHNLNLLDLIKIGYWFKATPTDEAINLSNATYGIKVWKLGEVEPDTSDLKLEKRNGYMQVYGDGIYAQELDTVYCARPFVTVDGTTYASDVVDIFSVPMYASSEGFSSQPSVVQDAVRDLLNYATDAQFYFLVRNEGYTEETLKNRTPINCVLNDDLKTTRYTENMKVETPAEIEDGTLTCEWVSATINLEEAISLNFMAKDQTDFVGMVYRYGEEYTGPDTLTVETNNGVSDITRKNGYAIGKIGQIYAKDIGDWFYARMYSGTDGSYTYGPIRVDSVAAYLTRGITKMEGQDLTLEQQYMIDTFKDMLAYGNSAYAYAQTIDPIV